MFNVHQCSYLFTYMGTQQAMTQRKTELINRTRLHDENKIGLDNATSNRDHSFTQMVWKETLAV